MNFLLTYTINNMTAEEIELAEEILKRYADLASNIALNGEIYCVGIDDAVDAMEAYHQAKFAEVTDKDIETWAENFVKNPEHYFHSVKDLIIGAKAFQKGEIKHVDNQ